MTAHKLTDILLRRGHNAPAGVSCVFIPYNRKGLKLYGNKRERNRCYNRQKKAATVGAAPKVGKRFTVKFPSLKVGNSEFNYPQCKVQTVYGYETQVARITGRDLSQKNFEVLHKKLTSISIYHTDLHGGNWGYIGKTPVCIDFDSASC
jgi:hypothetical protein